MFLEWSTFMATKFCLTASTDIFSTAEKSKYGIICDRLSIFIVWYTLETWNNIVKKKFNASKQNFQPMFFLYIWAILLQRSRYIKVKYLLKQPQGSKFFKSRNILGQLHFGDRWSWWKLTSKLRYFVKQGLQFCCKIKREEFMLQKMIEIFNFLNCAAKDSFWHLKKSRNLLSKQH